MNANVKNLQTLAQIQQRLVDITLLGASDKNEVWTNMEVITLFQHAKDQAQDIVWDTITPHSISTLNQQIHDLIKTRFNIQQEFVEIQQDKILVGINCGVVDDDVIDKAYYYACNLISFNVGTKQFFGKKIKLL
jgi:hypothetical protein